jgi:nucleotidyltransferase substrate binding protein (TIGR01987 family)
MNNDIRWKQRFQNFENAYSAFVRMVDRHEKTPDDEAVQMALLQSFEFTFEMSWNVMKDYLENEGYNEVGNSKQAVRVAFQAGLIATPEEWMDAIRMRNLTSHTYNQQILQETVAFIAHIFFRLVRDLYFDLKVKP